MRNNEKKATKSLFVLLFAMIAFACYMWVVAPMLEEKEVKEEKKKEEEKISLTEIGESLYARFALDESEEFGITTQDKSYMENKLTVYKMSDSLKINYGIKNLSEDYHMYDGKYSVKEAIKNMNGNFYYSGYYIAESAVEKSVDTLFGATPIKHQTIKLRDKLYVYKPYEQYYEIWEFKDMPKYSEEKITYKEVVAKEEEILVYEYIAYTDYVDVENIVTRTAHSNNVGVVITEENVAEYLSYMDKYRYTFKKNKDGNYYFVSLEYMYE